VLGKFANYSNIRDASGNRKTPEDALQIVAEVVNEQLTADIPQTDLDTLSYLNLIREFPSMQVDYDLARLTTVFGGNITVDNLDVNGGKGLIRKRGSKVNVLTGKQRVERGIINSNKPETLKTLIDVVHAAIIAYEERGTSAVIDILRTTNRDTGESGFIQVLKVIEQAGTHPDASKKLQQESKIVASLLEAMGHRTETTRKEGESLDDYVE
jgi:hypothetical protein